MFYQLNDTYHVRGLRETDVDGPYPEWFEDQEVCAFNSHGKFIKTRESFRRYVQNLNGCEMIVWAICHAQNGHIGNVSLQNISLINRHAEFAILLGDRRHWGKGIGTLAAKSIMAHGFNKLNLNRIYCGTAATNLAMKKLALDLGMKEEGVRRSHLFLNGSWTDALEFGILSEEFRLL